MTTRTNWKRIEIAVKLIDSVADNVKLVSEKRAVTGGLYSMGAVDMRFLRNDLLHAASQLHHLLKKYQVKG